MFFTSRNRKLVENVKRLEILEKNIIALNQENKVLLNVIAEREKALNKLIAEKSKGFPWLEEAIAKFYRYQDIEIANYLSTKKHPAKKAADNVKGISDENQLLRKQLKIAQNFVTYYETLFPWLSEYTGEDLNDLLEGLTKKTNIDSKEENDPVLRYITTSEYMKLSSIERNQKALNRYLESRKKTFEIGRDYERYIGYLYEREGFYVEYQGIEKGFEDLGRDLICKKGEEVEIVQCKYWSSHKTIHEKHINQLFGTAVKYFIDNRNFITNKRDLNYFSDLINFGKIKATFVTSTKLSDTARSFSKALGVKVIEQKALQKYPLIKCNISSSGEKIYHLPFDQQYDKTRIRNTGEFYVTTVEEAEQKGFRRAYRWKGGKNFKS